MFKHKVECKYFCAKKECSINFETDILNHFTLSGNTYFKSFNQ